MTRKLIFKYIGSLAVSLLTVFVAWVAISTSYGTWYLELKKSAFQLPDSVNAIIWAVLLILMGIAAARVLGKGFYHKWVQVAMYHYGLQLILTGFWFIIFFGLSQPLLAFPVILAILVVLFLTIKWFRVVNNLAAYMMYPVVVWMFYIAFLNFEIWRLN